MSNNDDKRLKGRILDWIDAPRFTIILDKFESMFKGEYNRKKVYLIGDEGTGKSSVVDRFYSMHGGIDGKILYLHTPPHDHDIKSLHAELLFEIKRELIDNFYNNFESHEKDPCIIKKELYMTLDKLKVRMIFLDNFEFLAENSEYEKKEFLHEMEMITLSINAYLVLIGLKNGNSFIDSRDELVREYEIIEVKNFRYGQKYINLLKGMEKKLPLKNRSNLHFKRMSKLIHKASKGKIGRISSIIERCARDAIRDGSEKITGNMIRDRFERWVYG